MVRSGRLLHPNMGFAPSKPGLCFIQSRSLHGTKMLFLSSERWFSALKSGVFEQLMRHFDLKNTMLPLLGSGRLKREIRKLL